jgi:hypothetical protein
VSIFREKKSNLSRKQISNFVSIYGIVSAVIYGITEADREIAIEIGRKTRHLGDEKDFQMKQLMICVFSKAIMI